MITIVKMKSRRLENIRDVFLRGLRDIDYVPKLSQIFLKPNIVDAVSYRDAVITDPNVVGGLILALEELGGERFVIGENSGFFSSNSKNFKRLIKTTRYVHLIKKLKSEYNLDLSLINLNDSELEEYPWPYGDGNIFLPRLIKTHSYINVAKMKTHMSTSVTLSMKNQKGLLLLKDKKGFHLGYGENTDLHSCIVRLSQIVKPELAMVDGTRALEGSGPTTAPEGLTNVRRLDLCVMGKDMIEVDNACCKIMGFDIKSVKHIPEVPVRLSKCSLPLATVKPPLKKPGNVLKIGNLRLHISKWMCTGCQMAYSRMIRKIMYSKELSKKFQILQKKEPVINMYMGKGCLALIEDARKRTGDKKPRIFFGTCATQASQDLEGIHISGCPPDYRKATKKIISLVDSNGEF